MEKGAVGEISLGTTVLEVQTFQRFQTNAVITVIAHTVEIRYCFGVLNLKLLLIWYLPFVARWFCTKVKPLVFFICLLDD